MHKEKIMFTKIIQFFEDLFSIPTFFEQLEQHIVNGNPQTPADVELLERGFYQRYQRDTLWNFHE